MKKVRFFDTSLRDGAQTPGVNLTAKDKIAIAKEIEKLGIDCLEAGFAIASDADFEAIQTISQNSKNMKVYSLARMVEMDIDRAYQALKDNIKNAGIHIFIGTSPLHRDFKLKMSKEQILEMVKKYVSYTSKLFEGGEIMFSPEDALRTEKDFLKQVIQTAVENGAQIINIPDTVGYAQTDEIYQLMKELTTSFPNVEFSIHCHNDLGNAVANSLSAIRGGTTMIQGTLPPLFGERAGNADLIQVMMNIKKRQDLYNYDISKINFKQIYPTVSCIEKYSSKKIPEHYPIVGRLVHSHSSGIHQHGVSQNKETYEIISPEEIGMKIEQSYILTNQSGKEGIKQAIKNYFGIELDDEVLSKIFVDFKQLTSKTKIVTMDDVRKILFKYNFDLNKKIEIVNYQVLIGYDAEQVVTHIVFKNKSGQEKYVKGFGNGPVDSVFDAIKKYIADYNLKIEIIDFQIGTLSPSSNAKAKVYIKAMVDGKIKEEYGIDENIVNASVKALLNLVERSM